LAVTCAGPYTVKELEAGQGEVEHGILLGLILGPLTLKPVKIYPVADVAVIFTESP